MWPEKRQRPAIEQRVRRRPRAGNLRAVSLAGHRGQTDFAPADLCGTPIPSDRRHQTSRPCRPAFSTMLRNHSRPGEHGSKHCRVAALRDLPPPSSSSSPRWLALVRRRRRAALAGRTRAEAEPQCGAVPVASRSVGSVLCPRSSLSLLRGVPSPHMSAPGQAPSGDKKKTHPAPRLTSG